MKKNNFIPATVSSGRNCIHSGKAVLQVVKIRLNLECMDWTVYFWMKKREVISTPCK